MSIFETIVQIIKDNLEDSEQDIELDTALKDLNIQSLDFVQILFDIENTFNIDIDDPLASQFKTVRDILSYLEGQGVS